MQDRLTRGVSRKSQSLDAETRGHGEKADTSTERLGGRARGRVGEGEYINVIPKIAQQG